MDFRKPIEELEAEIDGMTPSELEQFLNPPSPPAIQPKPRFRLPKPHLSLRQPSQDDLFNLACHLVMGMSAAAVLFFVVRDIPARWWAMQRTEPTKLDYCLDTDFEGRVCAFKTQSGEALRYPTDQLPW